MKATESKFKNLPANCMELRIEKTQTTKNMFNFVNGKIFTRRTGAQTARIAPALFLTEARKKTISYRHHINFIHK